MKRMGIWYLLNLPCEGASELISHDLDAKLPFGHRLAYRVHLLYCSACRRYRRQLYGLRTALRAAVARLRVADPPEGAGMPIETRSRIRSRLKRSN